jgi:hypothetical protein
MTCLNVRHALFLFGISQRVEDREVLEICFRPLSSAIWAHNRSKSSTRNHVRPAPACADRSGSATLAQEARIERNLPFASKYSTRSSPQAFLRVVRTNFVPRRG